MLRILSELKGYSIRATDGEIGSVDDSYFDDDHWVVRYVVVDTGGWLGGRKVLLSPHAVRAVDWAGRQVDVGLTRAQVEGSPDIDAERPVSRQHEAAYHDYYGWPYYWGGPYAWGMGAYPAGVTAVQAQRTRAEPLERERDKGDPHLRSVNEVTGYHVQATDDEIGHIEDIIVDDESWHLRYLVVDTSNWWFGKKVLVSPQWAERIDWAGQKVFVDQARSQIENAPEWDPEQPVNRGYEERLYDYYGRPTYWSA